MRSDVARVFVAVAIVSALAQFGLPERLGAHPFWGVKTGLIGAALGAAAGVALAVLRVPGLIRLGVGTVLLAATFAAAKLGAARFAASYGDDAFSGKMWFFGWIGTATGLTLFLWALFSLMARRR